MKMTYEQKSNRREAREWGRSCLSNIQWTLKQADEARSWKDHAAKVAKMFGASDTATDYAYEHAAHAWELSTSQNNQVKVNATRAAHYAIASLNTETK